MAWPEFNCNIIGIYVGFYEPMNEHSCYVKRVEHD